MSLYSFFSTPPPGGADGSEDKRSAQLHGPGLTSACTLNSSGSAYQTRARSQRCIRIPHSQPARQGLDKATVRSTATAQSPAGLSRQLPCDHVTCYWTHIHTGISLAENSTPSCTGCGLFMRDQVSHHRWTPPTGHSTAPHTEWVRVESEFNGEAGRVIRTLLVLMSVPSWSIQ